MKEETPNDKRGKGRPVGTKKLENLTDENYQQVELMSGIGLTTEQIAALLRISKKTFERMCHSDQKFNDAVKVGRANAIAKVSNVAFKMAMSGKNADMTRFYLRCRAGWSEKLNINANIKQEIIFATKIGDDGTMKVVSGKDDLQRDLLE